MRLRKVSIFLIETFIIGQTDPITNKLETCRRFRLYIFYIFCKEVNWRFLKFWKCLNYHTLPPLKADILTIQMRFIGPKSWLLEELGYCGRKLQSFYFIKTFKRVLLENGWSNEKNVTHIFCREIQIYQAF